MSSLKVDFGKRVQILRQQAGLTQESLASKIDVTVETISNIERGIHGARFDTLENLSKALRVPVKELFEFK